MKREQRRVRHERNRIEREQIYENPRKGVQRSRNGASFEEDPRHPGKGVEIPSLVEPRAREKGQYIYIKQVKQKPRTNNER